MFNLDTAVALSGIWHGVTRRPAIEGDISSGVDSGAADRAGSGYIRYVTFPWRTH